MYGAYESVQIEFPKYGERKIVVDGRELDLSKMRKIIITADHTGIDIDFEIPRQELPYK